MKSNVTERTFNEIRLLLECGRYLGVNAGCTGSVTWQCFRASGL